MFPEVLKDGQVDFSALKEQLGDFEEVAAEKFELNWAGKKASKKSAFENDLGLTLKTTNVPNEIIGNHNLYIEGENLKVLKLLRNNYYNAIDVIYIDPPYNTGMDLIYHDRYDMSTQQFSVLEGEMSEELEKYKLNLKSTGKYHTNWLNMMYPRLRVAKDLLSDDGVICVSISDVEEANLKLLLDEIFGEENYINTISVKAKLNAGASGGGEDKRLKKNIEYIHIYAKNIDSIDPLAGLYQKEELLPLIEEMKKNNQSWKYTSVLTDLGEREYLKTIKDGDGNPIEIFKRTNIKRTTINKILKEENITEEEAYSKYLDSIFSDTNAQTSIRTRVIEATGSLEDNAMYEVVYTPRSGKMKGQSVSHYYISNTVRRVIWLNDVAEVIDGKVYKKERLSTLWDDIDFNNIGKEGGVPYPNGKKPLELVKRCISISQKKDAKVLDFFGGSATTAEAVVALNAEDEGQRLSIIVQLNEDLDDTLKKSSGEAKKQIQSIIDYLDTHSRPHYLSEVGKQRIQNIKNMYAMVDDFLELALDETNIRWTHEALTEGQIVADEAEMTDKDKLDFMPGTKDIDVVYEVMLRQRDVPLSSSVELLSHIGPRTYMFADSYVVCLEEDITEELVEKLAAIDPLPIKYVLRDSAFGDNISLKEETFRRLQLLVERNTGVSKKTYTVEFL